MKKRKAMSASTEHRLTSLEDSVSNMQNTIDDIQLNVTNHIPTSIAKVQSDLQVLLDRKRDHEAVKNFLSNFFKCAVSFASIAYVLIQGMIHYYDLKEVIARLLLNN